MIDALKLFGPDAPPTAARGGDGAAVELAEPISLERAKSHLRVVFADEDADIAGMITAARQMAEGRLNRTLVQRQRVAAFPTFYGGMPLPKPPLVSVDTVEYLDTDGNVQSFTDFYVDEFAVPARVELTSGTAPLTRARGDAVRVTYTAGYADGDVPAPIISWMLLVLTTLYDNRATMAAGAQTYSIPDEFMSWMLQPYMVYE